MRICRKSLGFPIETFRIVDAREIEVASQAIATAEEIDVTSQIIATACAATLLQKDQVALEGTCSPSLSIQDTFAIPHIWAQALKHPLGDQSLLGAGCAACSAGPAASTEVMIAGGSCLGHTPAHF